MMYVKICGLKHNSDIEHVNTLLPDFVGFIFAKNSKRYVTPKEAAELKERLDKRIKAVGVFVDAELEFVAEIVSQGIIDIIQLHGKEDNSYIRSLREDMGILKPIIKAVSVSSIEDLSSAMESEADMILFDNGPGGTGKSFSWAQVAGFNRPFILAGGLSADNVATAIKACKPFAVDTSTGVETEGRKDFNKIQEFITTARRA